MARVISYKQALSLAVEDNHMVDYLEEAIGNHKNWGQFTMKIPSYVLVNLVDRLKELAEQSLGSMVPVQIEKEDFSNEEDESPF